MSRRRRAVLLTLAAACAAVALAGCGSGSLSAPVLRKRATKVCKLADARANAIPSPTTTAEAIKFLQRSVKVLRPELAALRKLRARSDAEPVYQRAVTALGGELAAIQHAAGQIGKSSDPTGAVQALQTQLDPLERRAAGAWHTLGIPACEST